MAISKLKWVQNLSKQEGLPFLIMYQAVGISLSLLEKEQDFERIKGGAIAIATSQLQKRNLLLKGTNTLSAKGKKFQNTLLGELGQKRAKEYITQFEELLKV